MTLMVKCPTCRVAVEWTAQACFKPFCSERCKLIDLGEWAMEEKRIPGESVPVENEFEDSSY